MAEGSRGASPPRRGARGRRGSPRWSGTGRASNRLGMYRLRDGDYRALSPRFGQMRAQPWGGIVARRSRGPRGTGMVRRFSISLALAAGLLSASAAMAEVKVAALIGDHMVVQQGQPVHLWGTARRGRGGARLAGGRRRGDASRRCGEVVLDPAGAAGWRPPHADAPGNEHADLHRRLGRARSGWRRGSRTWSSRSRDPTGRPRPSPEAARGCASSR